MIPATYRPVPVVIRIQHVLDCRQAQDMRRRRNRAQRRSLVYGHNHRWDAMAGCISPKNLRERGYGKVK